MLKLVIILAAAAVCNGNSVKYFSYTKRNPDVHQRQEMSCTGTWPAGGAPNFLTNDKTIILVHGHGGDVNSRFNLDVTHEILALPREDYNVVVVDWQASASGNYADVVRRVDSVATNIATCIKWLVAQYAVSIDDLHVVGFGLGAHVVGKAVREVNKDYVNRKIARITGLDPPGSQWGTRSGRLEKQDANYVEVIHTDSTGIFASGIGEAIGDADFYVNGGGNQPGCITHACSHDRAFEIFAASIGTTRLVGYPCSSSAQLNLNTCRGQALPVGGTDLSKPFVGNRYRVNTKRSWPFY